MNVSLTEGDFIELNGVWITHQGSMVGFCPRSEFAKQWFADNVDSAPWQWLGHMLWVDHRPARDLIEAIANLEQGKNQ